MEQNPKQSVVERLKSATNILVTVSSNPSVDQLAACIGFTLLLNKLGKHATAVFSGAVPSTLEFLQPEKTLEKNTDSLQDFIIALDKSKADKLRYKVEDDVVRIFITPYRTSISEKDLDFSLGDFNVDVVVAIGVLKKEELDQAIIAHGRILHDATVLSVTAGENISDIGSINWHEQGASSLSEMLVSISESFQSGLLDPQMATAFLTGIVAETERFSNAKTTPKVMTMSAQLMAAGANQQLIATKLTPPEPVVEPVAEQPVVDQLAQPVVSAPVPPEAPKVDGELEIEHEPEPVEPVPTEEKAPEDEDEIHIDDEGNLKRQFELEEARKAEQEAAEKAAREAEEKATAATPGVGADTGFIAAAERKTVDPLPGQGSYDPLLPTQPAATPPTEPELPLPPVQAEPPMPPEAPEQPEPTQPTASDEPLETLAQLEKEVDSPHVSMVDDQADVDAARQAVMTAGLDVPPRPQPMQSLGAQPLSAPPEPVVPLVPPMPQPTMAGIDDILHSTSSIDDTVAAPTPSLPPMPPLPPQPTVAPPTAVNDPTAPPPVPPPMTAAS